MRSDPASVPGPGRGPRSAAARAAGTARAAGAVLALALGAAGCGRDADPASAGPEVRVAAASDLRPAAEDLRAAFAAEAPGVRLEFVMGSSGGLLAQVENGAPFDVYLSADLALARRLAASGLADPDGTFAYARGRLAVWAAAASAAPIETAGLAGLADAAVKRIALADPAHAPYGTAALAALERAGIASAVRDRLVFGSTAAQAAHFLESGAADAGVIAHSLALAPPLRDRGRSIALPEGAHPPLDQGGAVLRRARHPGAATAFRRFLLGPRGRTVLARHGFLAPPE